MVMRRVVAALALLCLVFPVAPVGADEPGQDPGTGGQVEAFLRPDATTWRVPWIAHLGDLASMFAVPVLREGGTVPYTSCTYRVDGVKVEGSVDPRFGWCELERNWDRLGSVDVTVDLALEDGRHVTRTEVVEVRERPAQRLRLLTRRHTAIAPAPPEMDIDGLAAFFGDPSLDGTQPETPCAIYGRGLDRTFPPTVRCTHRGDFVLVVSDADTGWSLRIDLVVRNRRAGWRS